VAVAVIAIEKAGGCVAQVTGHIDVGVAVVVNIAATTPNAPRAVPSASSSPLPVAISTKVR
jgi:hypothetical protein